MVTGLFFLLETIFSVALVGQIPQVGGGVCRIRTGESCLEGRGVTATLIRRKGHPKLTMPVTAWLQTLSGGKFYETKGVQRWRSLSLEWLG